MGDSGLYDKLRRLRRGADDHMAGVAGAFHACRDVADPIERAYGSAAVFLNNKCHGCLFQSSRPDAGRPGASEGELGKFGKNLDE